MFRVALKIVFFCKLAKDQPFDNCQLKTPQGRTLNATKNGEPVIDSETGDVFDQNVRALLELEDGQGNLLNGIVIWFVRREGIESTEKVSSLFSNTLFTT